MSDADAATGGDRSDGNADLGHGTSGGPAGGTSGDGMSGGTHDPAHPGASRRAILLGLLGAAGLGALGFAIGRATAGTGAPGTGMPAGPGSTPAPTLDPALRALVPAAGATQAGIARPDTPQSYGLLLVADLPVDPGLAGSPGTGSPGAPGALPWLAALGEQILALTGGEQSYGFLPAGPGDLTVTVGLGPRVVALVDPGAPGSEALPLFAGDETIDPQSSGGDLLLAVYGSDPGVLAPVVEQLLTAVPGATARWSQRLFRGPSEGTITRNPLGFHDGVIVPRGEEELAESVWLDGPFAGGSICVIRRLRLADDVFLALSEQEQNAVIGRQKTTGAPLSGGGQRDQVDLLAKSPDGEYVTPLHSHARAAHPSFTGSGLMLRRGYAFDEGTGADGVANAGLTFICFQNELRTFVATQHRLDETDALMSYVTPTASATFLILPGFTADRPLAFPA
ncbi:Dyp-type peroxidase [Compostimonas suwonensis]|uniref:Dye decolorizing peroxidase n=1 Tax=Compostimonas suwonensis TaxID=1048394 RepID=A0A2M9C4I5_9MICO|nr:Dyp-type peroxidase [Compostimonas suwonensis]PJJ65422.1 dye decolorizing peroxidase [Compostimonas suwonensis]